MRLVTIFIIVLVLILEPLLLSSGVLHVNPDLIINNLEFLINFLYFHTVDLHCKTGKRGIKLLILQWFMTHNTGLFENFLNFQLWQRYLKILAELHELSKVYLTHGFFELFKFPILRYMLSRVKVEDLLKAPSSQL